MSSRSLWIGLALAWLSSFLASAQTTFASAPATSSSVDPAPGQIWGAVYIPSGAYNAPQMWKNFNLAETRRDFGYAQKLHLNALRVWASYEYWLQAPHRFKASLDQFLAAAHDAHFKILLSLFDSNGVPPTPQNMWSTDPKNAFCIMSPGPKIWNNPASWDKPREYLTWFMNNYRNDDRLIAIEVFNEPGPQQVAFTQSMLQTAKSLKGTIPLTLGLANVAWAKDYAADGLDIIQFHANFPRSAEDFKKSIENALAVGHQYNLPVWLTEWQRVRPTGEGWALMKLTEEEKTPDYASLASIVRQYPIGSFFWSVMVKPAYLVGQRKNGTINGLFWPDGSVWSLQDARAIADDPSLTLPEKKKP